MKKLLCLGLATFLLNQNVFAFENEKQIPISQIEILQGTIEIVTSPLNKQFNYVYIGTNDNNGWAINDYDFKYKENDKVIIVFDNMGTTEIYDDEIIKIVEIES